MGISYNAFKKYFNLANKAGLLIKRGNNFQAVHFVKCLHVLGLNDRLNRSDAMFNDFDYPVLTFNAVYEQIIFATVTNNFKKQRYKINQDNFILTDNRNYKAKVKALKLAASLAASKGVDTVGYLQSISNRKRSSIVTGKFHISAIIGCSPTSGLNWLRKFHTKKMLNRKVNREFIQSTGDPDQYYDLIHSNRAGMVYPAFGNFYNCKGSVITLLP